MCGGGGRTHHGRYNDLYKFSMEPRQIFFFYFFSRIIQCFCRCRMHFWWSCTRNTADKKKTPENNSEEFRERLIPIHSFWVCVCITRIQYTRLILKYIILFRRVLTIFSLPFIRKAHSPRAKQQKITSFEWMEHCRQRSFRWCIRKCVGISNDWNLHKQQWPRQRRLNVPSSNIIRFFLYVNWSLCLNWFDSSTSRALSKQKQHTFLSYAFGRCSRRRNAFLSIYNKLFPRS